MSGSRHRFRLTVKAIAAAKPKAKEYTLWDNLLAHFGVRVQPSGVQSYILQTRVNGRMRKITLGRFPELALDAARREGAAVLARLWGGEDVTPPRKNKAPLFRDFAARYRARRRHRWKPSSLKTFDIYLRNRLMPHFGRLRLDAIDHTRVSAWFDAASANGPGAANRAFEILRAMLTSARQWGELDEGVPDACANIVRNARRPVARYLDHAELERLGAALDRRREHPWPVAAIRLLTLTGARLSEVINLKWDEIGELGENGARAHRGLQDRPAHDLARTRSGTAARGAAPARRQGAGVSRGPHVGSPLHVLGRYPGGSRAARTSHPRLPPHLSLAGRHERCRAHHCRRLLGHRQRGATAIYAHLDDGALRDVAALAVAVIARAMGYSAEPPPLPDQTDDVDDTGGGRELDWSDVADRRAGPADPLAPATTASRPGRLDWTEPEGGAEEPPGRPALDWL